MLELLLSLLSNQLHLCPAVGGVGVGGGVCWMRLLTCSKKKSIHPAPHQPLTLFNTPTPHKHTHTTFAALLADLSTLSDFLSGRSLSPGLVGDAGGVEGSATPPSPPPSRPSSPTPFFYFFSARKLKRCQSKAARFLLKLCDSSAGDSSC